MKNRKKIEDILLTDYGCFDDWTVDKLCDLSIISNWVAYDWNDISSRPHKYGKYFVHRKDGKVHWETWNGSGWAYNEKVITHWQEVKPPC
uniref:hypothetical protein n=1 Tax=Roseivirga sp. TaxID=1964215 RepID=UPI004047B217